MLYELVMSEVERWFFSSQQGAGKGRVGYSGVSAQLYYLGTHRPVQVIQPCFPKERVFDLLVWNWVWVIAAVCWFRITFTFLFALAVLFYETAVWINDSVINSHADSDAVVFNGGCDGFTTKHTQRNNLLKTLMLSVRIPETCFGIRKFPFCIY